MRTPLAWKNLTHDRKRLALAVGGIGFAVLLMFMQLGFRGALFDSTLALPRRFDADIVLMHTHRYTLTVRQKFPRRYLDLARASTAVISAVPLYFESNLSNWKLPGQPVGPPIRVLGFDPKTPPLLLPELAAEAERLMQTDTVLFDRMSKEDFGDLKVGDVAELNGQRVRVVGDYRLGTDFADDGTILCSDRTFNSIFYSYLPGDTGLHEADFGLIRLQKGADLTRVRDEIDALLPPNVHVMTREQFLDTEFAFWNKATPIGYIFALGTVMGFIVGMIICYQILFSDISDHLREFATLKAMGYRPQYFVGLVLQEALLLSVFGFVPGLVAGLLLYEIVTLATGLQVYMSMPRVFGVVLLTALMCIISGVLTMRKVVTTDPAELF
ncbi:MAG: ABC transporter permease DevC [Planctomycetia bacterium]|nr:ABC transporter permease DevC [Planctomycetia bacterium]